MPFEGNHADDIGLETPEGSVCIYDSENGVIKTPEAIFKGGVLFFAQTATNGDTTLAERLTRKNMKSLPYWQAHHCVELDGPEATDEEFQAVIEKL